MFIYSNSETLESMQLPILLPFLVLGYHLAAVFGPGREDKGWQIGAKSSNRS